MEITGLAIHGRFTPCAHSCRYCSMAEKKIVAFPHDRFLQFIERLIDWRDANRPGLRIAIGDHYSAEKPIETERAVKRVRQRTGFDLGRMHLGGLKMRSVAETEAWMQERYALGFRFANASYAGIGATHDHWNRRPGDFAHLLGLQRAAAKQGMELGQYLFVARSTLPQIDRLLEHLDALPRQAVERFLVPIGYIGWGRGFEDERIGEAERDALLGRLAPLVRDASQWKSEREWMRVDAEDDAARQMMLRLELDDSNIDRLEALSPQQVFDEISARTRAACRDLPTWDELRDRRGDARNDRIYASRDEMQRKWLDLHGEAVPLAGIERRLTALAETY